ncbi:MAG: hypothetical protein RL748_3603 [Pseudomonadota bacterium]|jgi:hypothetical protein
MKEFLHCVLLIWQYGMPPSLLHSKGNLPSKNWLFYFFPNWYHFITYYLLLLIPGAFIGGIKVAGFAMNHNWIVSIVFTLSFPLLWRTAQLWLVFCESAVKLLQSDSVHLLPKIDRHARLACVLSYLILTTVTALLIALRFGSFWWAFWGIGTTLLFFSRILGKTPKRLLIALPQILILFPISPLLRTDAALLICLLMLFLACIHLYRTMFWSANDSTPNKATRQPNLPSLYAKLLQRDCANRSPTLILHSIWPRRPWSSIGSQNQWLYGFLPIAIATAWITTSGSGSYVSAYHGSLWQLFGQLIFIPLALALMNEDPLLVPMKQTRHEQALFRLSPLAPDSRHLNQVLARLLLRERFFDWLCISCMYMFCAALFGISGEILLAQLAACTIRLPLIAEPLKNGARLAGREQDYDMSRVRKILTWNGSIFLLAFSAYFLVRISNMQTDWAPHFLGWWSAGLLLINLTLTAKHLPRRWRVIVTSPFVFSFGRLDVDQDK